MDLLSLGDVRARGVGVFLRLLGCAADCLAAVAACPAWAAAASAALAAFSAWTAASFAASRDSAAADAASLARVTAASAARAASDLMVTWTDGEVTLYTNVDAKGLHAEKLLVKPPDTTWSHARDIAAGDFRTGTGDQDLFVRWSDGEVTAYENIAAETFGREHRLLPAKSPWREALLVTAGSFGGPALQNDLVALWPGGKLTLHPDTTSTDLPAERMLVSP